MTFDDLKRIFKYTDDLIYFTLDELRANDLIEGEATNHFGHLSRREIVKRAGLATMVALPVIAGLTAPNAVQAASCVNRGGAPAGATVAVTITNPSAITSDNQNEAGRQLRAKCCSNFYQDFDSNGCNSGVNGTCNAVATCI